MTVAVTWWAVGHARTLETATSVLSGLDLGWVLLAGGAAAATWIFSGVSQQGALAPRLPFGRLLATQFAGTFANQFTPAGLGGSAVNVRFLRRRGITSGEAVAAVGLTQIAGVVVHVSLLLAVLAADPPWPTVCLPATCRCGSGSPSLQWFWLPRSSSAYAGNGSSIGPAGCGRRRSPRWPTCVARVG